MRLRSSIYWVTLIALLLAANLSAQAGTVGLGVSVQGTGGNCPQGNVVCRGCTVKIVATASDCDEWDSQCCWDDLEFPVWELGSPPTRQADGSYRSESIVTCDWIGPRTFNFSANDLVHCTNQEDDLPATQTVTITCIEVVDLTGPTEPICPGTNLEFQVTTSPDNLGVGLLTWTGGEDGEVSPYDLHIYHADFSAPGTYDVSAKCGEQGITRQVVVDEPVYEVTFLEPVGVVGGLARVMVQVKTRCAGLVGNGVLIQRENPDGPYCQDGWCPLEGGHPTWEESSGPDQEGIYTSIFKTYWDTLSLKNGTYHLRAKGSFSVAPDWQQEVPFEVPLSVNVKNLSFTSADPEGVIAWKGEENETESLTVHLEDNDLTDPITLSFRFYSTARDNSYGERSCDAAVTRDFPDGLAGGSYTLHLNSSEWNVDPGLYTYEVEAIQTDICNTDPDLQIEDRARYRSEHLSLRRGVDEMGPVYTAEYYGYDDKNTTDEEDDDFLYFIRLYKISSSNPICGSEGEVWLYDPTLTKVYSCGLGGLECLKHPAPDGLCSGEHAIVIPVPANVFQYAGVYRFVLHVKDDHHELYRNGEDRWALDLNVGTGVNGVAAWSTAAGGFLENTHGLASHMLGIVSKVSKKPQDYVDGKALPGYVPYPPPGDPAKGGSGHLKDVSGKLTIRTLNRLCPKEAEDHPEFAKYLTKNAIWAFYGHGNPIQAAILFDVGDSASGIWVDIEFPQDQQYMISKFDLSHVRIAFLASCYSAGGHEYGGMSIAEAFTKIPNGKGAKAAVGIRGKVKLTFPIFGTFNHDFWAYVSKWGYTVKEAMKEAARYIKDIPGVGVKPVLFGDGKIKLYPPP